MPRSLCLFLSALLFIPFALARPMDPPYETVGLRGLSMAAEHHTQLAEQDWQWLRSKEELVLGTYPLDLPPFEFVRDNKDEMSGLTADIAALLTRELGVGIVVHSYASREAALQALATGGIDMLGTESDARSSATVALSSPYVMAKPVLFMRTGESWGVPQGGAAKGVIAYNPLYMPTEEVAELFPHAKLKVFSSDMAMFSAVAFGEVEAGLSSSISAYYIINKHYPNDLRVARMLDVPGLEGYSFAIQPDNTQLLRVINAAIESGLSPSLKQAVLHRWSGGGVTRTHELQFSRTHRLWIAQHPIVRVGVAENFPPFSYYGTDGNYYGVTADFLSVIQAETGLQVQIERFATIHGLFEALENKQIDIVADVSPTLSRQEEMAFTRPYLTTPMALITRTGINAPRSLDDLSGKRLALPREHALIPYIHQHYPKIQIVETQDIPETFHMVKVGKADALLQPLNTARYYIIRLYKDDLQISMTLDDRSSAAAFAMRRDDKELRDIFDQALANLAPDEESMLSNRWFSQVVLAPQSWRSYRELVYQGISIGGVLLLLFLGWNFYLWQQIRKRKRAEKALNDQMRFMDTLINGTPHPIYVRDSNMKLIICNDSYLREYQVTREEAIGSTNIGHGALRVDNERELENAHLQVISKREPIVLDRRLFLNGTARTIYHWLLPYEDVGGRMRGVIGGWIDISERDQLIAELQSARDQANLANRTKTTFLATMSHEIRTPLNAVIGMLELVLKRATVEFQDRELIETAHGSARGLLDLIGEILDISRIETGKLTLTPQRANLRQLIESVVQVFDGLARQKSLELKLQLDPQLDQDFLIDPLRFKQVLSNLVSNAIKFTNSGAVRVVAGAVPTDAENLELQLSVIDSGIGISAQDQQRLFQAFSQVKEGSGGAGLGLMISRNLCQMMGGTLVLESQEQVGTQVQVKLPARRLEAYSAESVANQAEMLPLPKLKVLIVDDHGTNRALLAYQLEHLGQSVSSAENGVQALETWRTKKFDLVITDCNMPLMDGFELTRGIRAEEAEQGIAPCAIMGLTAAAQQEMRDRCIEAGMDGCLFKPIELDDLERVLREFVAAEGTQLPLEIDFDRLKNSTGGNTQLIRLLLSEMLTTSRRDLPGLLTLSSHMEIEEIADLAHRIKGAAKIIKAGPLIEHCESLEAACRMESPKDIDAERKRLYAYVDRFCTALQTWLEGANKSE